MAKRGRGERGTETRGGRETELRTTTAKKINRGDSATALDCVGGQMQGRLVVRGNEDKALCARHGIAETDRKYGVADMAAGDATFAATGVTGGHLLAGVRGHREGAVTHSVVMRSKSGTVRYIEAHHDFTRRPGAAGGRPK